MSYYGRRDLAIFPGIVVIVLAAGKFGPRGAIVAAVVYLAAYLGIMIVLSRKSRVNRVDAGQNHEK
jgi:hypothetical protein